MKNWTVYLGIAGALAYALGGYFTGHMDINSAIAIVVSAISGAGVLKASFKISDQKEQIKYLTGEFLKLKK